MLIKNNFRTTKLKSQKKKKKNGAGHMDDILVPQK